MNSGLYRRDAAKTVVSVRSKEGESVALVKILNTCRASRNEVELSTIRDRSRTTTSRTTRCHILNPNNAPITGNTNHKSGPEGAVGVEHC